MKLLGVESASRVASVAVAEGRNVLAQKTICDTRTHSETLLPMVDDVLREAGLTLDKLDGIAVSVGPGSFTGLRIGAALVKGLAFAAHKRVFAVPTIDSMAYGFRHLDGLIVPILDARRQEVYTGLFGMEDGEFTVYVKALVTPLTDILTAAKETAIRQNKKVYVIGDGLSTLESRVREIFPEAILLSGTDGYQTAASVAAYAEDFSAEPGVETTPEALTPVYFRLSQAEQEREAKGLPVEDLANIEKNIVPGKNTEEAAFIRPMTMDDVPAVAALEESIFTDAWSIGELYEIFQYGVCHGYVYEENKTIVGYIITTEVLDEENIDNIAVIPSARRKGIGRKMISFVLEKAREAKKTTMFLEVRAKNEAAIALYQSFGFTAYRTRKDYYKNPVDDAVCYALDMKKG